MAPILAYPHAETGDGSLSTLQYRRQGFDISFFLCLRLPLNVKHVVTPFISSPRSPFFCAQSGTYLKTSNL